jgi:hypothetical protein
MPALTRPAKITFSEMRDTGVRGILIYCSDYKCSTRLQSAATDGLMTSGSPISKRGSYAKPAEREGLMSGRTPLEQAAGRDDGISVVPWSSLRRTDPDQGQADRHAAGCGAIHPEATQGRTEPAALAGCSRGCDHGHGR